MSTQAVTNRITGQLPSLNDWQLEALTEAVAAARHRGVDIEARLRRLAATGARFELRTVLESLRLSQAADDGPIPYHLPTCQCGGDGLVDGPPIDYSGRQYTTVARCPDGGPITRAIWEGWQATGWAHTPVGRDRRTEILAAARAALPRSRDAA